MLRSRFSYDVITYNMLSLEKKGCWGTLIVQTAFSFTDKNNKVSRSHYSNCINLTDKKTIKFKITLSSDTNTFTNVLVSIIGYIFELDVSTLHLCTFKLFSFC